MLLSELKRLVDQAASKFDTSFEVDLESFAEGDNLDTDNIVLAPSAEWPHSLALQAAE